MDNDFDYDSYKRTQGQSNGHPLEPDPEDLTYNPQRNQCLRSVPDRYGNQIPSELMRKTKVQKGEVMSWVQLWVTETLDIQR